MSLPGFEEVMNRIAFSTIKSFMEAVLDQLPAVMARTRGRLCKAAGELQGIISEIEGSADPDKRRMLFKERVYRWASAGFRNKDVRVYMHDILKMLGLYYESSITDARISELLSDIRTLLGAKFWEAHLKRDEEWIKFLNGKELHPLAVGGQASA